MFIFSCYPCASLENILLRKVEHSNVLFNYCFKFFHCKFICGIVHFTGEMGESPIQFFDQFHLDSWVCVVVSFLHCKFGPET